MIDALDDGHFLGNHLYLLLVQSLGLDHLYRIALDLTILSALVDVAGSPCSDLSHELVVIDFFQKLAHISNDKGL